MVDKIYSPHFVKGSVSSKPQAIKREEIKSMVNEYVQSPTSHGYGNNFFYTVKNGNVFLRTSNRLERYPLADVARWGKPTVQYFEEGSTFMDSWYSAGNNNPPNKYDIIPRIQDIAGSKSVDGVSYIAGVKPLRIFLPGHRDTNVNLFTTPRIVEAVDINSIGKYDHKRENLRQTLNSILINHPHTHYTEAAEWIGFLAKKGISIDKSPNVGVIGLGIERGNYYAAYYPHERGFLVSEYNFHDKSKNLTSRYGLSGSEAVEAMKRSILLHEIAHVLGIRGNRRSEKLQGELQAEFYSMMSQRYKGTKLERIYRALAQEGSDYVKEFSLSQSGVEEIKEETVKKEPLDYLIDKFMIEGFEMGKQGEELGGYIHERVQDSIGPIIGGEPSYKDSRAKSKAKQNSKNKKSPRAKGLEALMETLRKEAKNLNVDEAEYISSELARSPVRYLKGYEAEADISQYEGHEKNYEKRAISEKDHNSMGDVKDGESKADGNKKPKEAEPKEAAPE